MAKMLKLIFIQTEAANKYSQVQSNFVNANHEPKRELYVACIRPLYKHVNIK